MGEYKFELGIDEETLEPVVDDAEMARYIEEKTGVNALLVEQVLEAEVEYLKACGIVFEDEI